MPIFVSGYSLFSMSYQRDLYNKKEYVSCQFTFKVLNFKVPFNCRDNAGAFVPSLRNVNVTMSIPGVAGQETPPVARAVTS